MRGEEMLVPKRGAGFNQPQGNKGVKRCHRKIIQDDKIII
jgi:hypothetical protein